MHSALLLCPFRSANLVSRPSIFFSFLLAPSSSPPFLPFLLPLRPFILSLSSHPVIGGCEGMGGGEGGDRTRYFASKRRRRRRRPRSWLLLLHILVDGRGRRWRHFIALCEGRRQPPAAGPAWFETTMTVLFCLQRGREGGRMGDG